MITDSEKWHYVDVKSLSVLFGGITSNKNGDFYCLNCFCLYRTEKKAYLVKQLSASQKQAVLKLIEKKGRDKRYIQNLATHFPT